MHEAGHEMMNEAEVAHYITTTFDGVHAIDTWGDTFFYYNPAREQPDEFYFATIKSKDDDYDNVSNLNRPDTFRLNIGIGKESYFSHFEERPPRAGADGIDATAYDYTALDQWLPHPIYGRMYWVCVINPSAATFAQGQPLLAEAYALAVAKFEQRVARK